jgi:hypothetical protein
MAVRFIVQRERNTHAVILDEEKVHDDEEYHDKREDRYMKCIETGQGLSRHVDTAPAALMKLPIRGRLPAPPVATLTAAKARSSQRRK